MINLRIEALGSSTFSAFYLLSLLLVTKKHSLIRNINGV